MRKCAGCKQEFRKEELVEYSSLSGKSSAWYCKDCLVEKQARERFSIKVCELFGLKSPGPRIWTERKRLRDTYGYTDDAIVDCLEYIYHVINMKKLKESLGLVNPRNMEGMRKWRKEQKAQASSIAAAIANTEIREYKVPFTIKPNVKKEINITLIR